MNNVMVLKERALRQEFSRYCNSTPAEGKPLKTILLVGAAVEGEDELRIHDSYYLKRSLHMLQAMGIAVSPDFTVEIVNIDPQYGGKDFLSEAFEADIIVSCYIFNGSMGIIQPQGAKIVSETYRGLIVSEHRSAEKAWHDSAKRAGAKVVAAFGARSEVNASHFEGEHYITILENEDFVPGTILLDRGFAKKCGIQPHHDDICECPKYSI